MLNQRRSQQRDIHGQTAHSVSSRGAIVGAAACLRPALPARAHGTFGRGPQGPRDDGPTMRRSLEWEVRGGGGGRPSARYAVALHEGRTEEQCGGTAGDSTGRTGGEEET